MASRENCISFSTLAAFGVDREARVIRGVAALSQGPTLGHGLFIDERSLATTLACAQSIPGGIRVVMDHTENVGETQALATNWRIDGTVLRCDVEFLQSAGEAGAKILELAERSPESFGLSIHFRNVTEKRGELSVPRCTKLLHLAIVEEAAATRGGLYGTFSAVSGTTQIQAMPYTPEEVASKIDALSAAVAGLTEKLSSIQMPDTAKPEAELAALRSEVAALKSTVAKEVVSFGSRAAALEQQITPKDERPAELVSFSAKVKSIREASPKIHASAAIARAAAQDSKGHAAWLKAGQPNL